MLFDLITAAKLSIKIEYPNKFLLFIENLCFAIWKFRVYLKIPIGRNKIKIPIRLKITEWSKNYGLKIPVRVCVCVCMCVRMRVCVCVYARASDCRQIVIRTHDHDQHKTSTPPDTARTEHTTTGKGATTKIKFAYIIGMIAKNDKKNEKKLKKICRYRNLLYLCIVIKKQTSLTTTKLQHYGGNKKK